MDFRCAGIIQNSIVDGLGLRMAVFFQGCKHKCQGCHNQHTWSFLGGYVENTNNIIKNYEADELLTGVTLTGGDPFEQPVAANDIATRIKQLGGDIWCYTGYLYEELISATDKKVKELLSNIDILVDGPFILSLRDITLPFKGSSNQRTLKLLKGEIIERVN